MSPVYLITGFLGAGKTSFVRNFAGLFRGSRIRLIINDFGQENVDAELLGDLQAAVREVSGGSVFCACRIDQFEKVLHECGSDEIIIVEASGLADPTGVRKLLSAGRFPNLQYRGCILLADAVRFHKVYSTALSSVRQLAAADVAIINKKDLAGPEQLSRVHELIRGQRPDIPVFESCFGSIPQGLMEVLDKSQGGDRENLPEIMDISSKKMALHIPDSITAYDLEMFIRSFAENTYRVKGFILTSDRGLVLADCVSGMVSLRPAPPLKDNGKIGVLDILSGGKMPMRSCVKKACAIYSRYPIEIL